MVCTPCALVLTVARICVPSESGMAMRSVTSPRIAARGATGPRARREGRGAAARPTGPSLRRKARREAGSPPTRRDLAERGGEDAGSAAVESWFWRFRRRKAHARSRVAGNRPRRANPGVDRHRNVPIRYPLTTRKRAKDAPRGRAGDGTEGTESERHGGVCEPRTPRLRDLRVGNGEDAGRRVERAACCAKRHDHRKIYFGFSSATTVLSGVINGHFARLSSFGPFLRRKALEKIALDRSTQRGEGWVAGKPRFNFPCPTPIKRKNLDRLDDVRALFRLGSLALRRAAACTAVCVRKSGRRLKRKHANRWRALHTSRWRRKPRKATWRTSRSTLRKSSSRSS